MTRTLSICMNQLWCVIEHAVYKTVNSGVISSVTFWRADCCSSGRSPTLNCWTPVVVRSEFNMELYIGFAVHDGLYVAVQCMQCFYRLWTSLSYHIKKACHFVLANKVVNYCTKTKSIANILSPHKSALKIMEAGRILWGANFCCIAAEGGKNWWCILGEG